MTAPRDEGLCLFRSVTGELTAMDHHGSALLRYSASDRPLEGRFARWLPSTPHAHVASRAVLRAIAAHLAASSTVVR